MWHEEKKQPKAQAKLKAAPQVEEEEKLDEQSQEIVDLVKELFTEKFCDVFDPDMRAELEEAEHKETAASFKDSVGDMLQMLKNIMIGGSKADSALQDSEDEEAEEVGQAAMDLISKTVQRLLNEKIDEFYVPVAKQARDQ